MAHFIETTFTLVALTPNSGSRVDVSVAVFDEPGYMADRIAIIPDTHRNPRGIARSIVAALDSVDPDDVEERVRYAYREDRHAPTSRLITQDEYRERERSLRT